METTVQVRVNKELASLLDLTVKKGLYSSRSEAVRDAIRQMFAPQLRDEILTEALKRARSRDTISHEALKRELGL